MSIGKDGHVYRDHPLPEPTPDFIAALDKTLREMEAMPTAIGMELMNRWNKGLSNPPDMAILGHFEGDEYKFIIERNGKTMEITVKELK